MALDPHDGLSRGRLGAVELEQGEVDAALSDLLAASNQDMGSAEIRGWYGRALFAKGEHAHAVEQLRKAIELDPESAEHPFQLGRALERQASLPEAIDAYQAAQARAPNAWTPTRRWRRSTPDRTAAARR